MMKDGASAVVGAPSFICRVFGHSVSLFPVTAHETSVVPCGAAPARK